MVLHPEEQDSAAKMRHEDQGVRQRLSEPLSETNPASLHELRWGQ
jgi:hypothetical protein